MQPFYAQKARIDSPDIPTFEEISKTAYSHGLEAIYKIENIDLKSIRTFRKEASDCKRETFKLLNKEETASLNLDLGPAFRGWMEPFVLDEPIQLLVLPESLKLKLFERNIKKIGELLNALEQHSLKDFSRWEAEELRGHLKKYLGLSFTLKSDSADFKSLLNCLLADLDQFFLQNLLELYGLASFFLPGSETDNLKPLKSEDFKRRVVSVLQTEDKRKFVEDAMVKIVESFLKPWMQRRRMGIAEKHEILEYLYQISKDEEIACKAICFLSELYFSKQFPLRASLIPLSKEIYASDPWSAEAYKNVEKEAQSYFSGKNSFFLLSHLEKLLLQFFARQWVGFPNGFIMKVLYSSPLFLIEKCSLGHSIRLRSYVEKIAL